MWRHLFDDVAGLGRLVRRQINLAWAGTAEEGVRKKWREGSSVSTPPACHGHARIGGRTVGSQVQGRSRPIPAAKHPGRPPVSDSPDAPRPMSLPTSNCSSVIGSDKQTGPSEALRRRRILGGGEHTPLSPQPEAAPLAAPASKAPLAPTREPVSMEAAPWDAASPPMDTGFALLSLTTPDPGLRCTAAHLVWGWWPSLSFFTISTQISHPCMPHVPASRERRGASGGRVGTAASDFATCVTPESRFCET